jgi:hypothetical protein
MTRRKPSRKTNYTLDQALLEQYGLGGWLKKATKSVIVDPLLFAADTSLGGLGLTNAITDDMYTSDTFKKLGKVSDKVAPTVGKVAAGVVGGVVGGPAGAMAGVSGMTALQTGTQKAQGTSPEDVAQKAQNKSIKQQNAQTNATNQLNQRMQQNPQQVYAPTYADGGLITDNVGNPVLDKTGNVIGMKPTVGWESDPNYKSGFDTTQRPHSEPVTTLQSVTRKDMPFTTPGKPGGLYRDVTTRDPEGIYNTKSYNEASFDSLKTANPALFKTNPNFAGLATKANGGLLQYNGQTHQGPDGGIPVDAQGNSSAQSGNKPVALTENKEVAWNSPNEGSYIFSENLGFSKEAQRIMKRYEKRLGKDFDKEDPISLNTMNKQLGDLKNQQETVRQQEGLQEEDMKATPEYKKGGFMGIQKNHAGYCTPMTKETCTPHRKALARTLKKHHGFHKKEDGGYLNGEETVPVLAKGGGLPTYGGPNRNNNYSGYLPEEGFDTMRSNVYSGFEQPNYTGIANNPIKTPLTIPNTIPLVDQQKMASNTSAAQPDLYTGSPWLQVGTGAASLLGNALMQGADKRNRPKSIALSRYTPKRVDYSESRRQTKEESALDKANLLRSMRGMGAGYMANATNAVTGADRAKYNALAQSMEGEQNINVQMENEAGQRNAEVSNREQLINMQNQDAYQARQRQYGQNYGQTIANTIGAVAQERAYYDALNMNPYYDILKDTKGQKWAGRTFAPRKRFYAGNKGNQ